MQPICDSALRERLPSAYALKPFVHAGMLMSYGVDLAEARRRAAGYVDRILRGEQPGNLPIAQMNRYELAINRRTAETLGVRVPSHLLLMADEIVG